MEEPLSVEELERIEARARAATPGPWEVGVRYERFGVNEGSRPGEGPFSFLPVGRCFHCAETGEAPLGTEHDRHGGVYHVHRVPSEPGRPAGGWRTVSSAATRQPVVESYAGIAATGIRPGDAEFVAHARADVPRLAAEVRKLRAALDALERLQRGTDAARETMLALRDESRRLRAEREEALRRLQRSRVEARRGLEPRPAGG